MGYAHKILSDELRFLRKLLKESDWSNHPEALKDRMKKCRDLDKAIKMIEESKGVFTDRQVGSYNKQII